DWLDALAGPGALDERHGPAGPPRRASIFGGGGHNGVLLDGGVPHVQAVRGVVLSGRFLIQDAAIRPEHRIQVMRRAQPGHRAETTLPEALEVVVIADL